MKKVEASSNYLELKSDREKRELAFGKFMKMAEEIEPAIFSTISSDEIVRRIRSGDDTGRNDLDPAGLEIS